MQDFDVEENLTLALRNAGHINVEEVYQIYKTGQREGDIFIESTMVEYLHSDGTTHTDPLDIDLVAVYDEAIKLRDEQDLALAEIQGLTSPEA